MYKRLGNNYSKIKKKNFNKDNVNKCEMHKKLRSVNFYYQGKLSLRCLAYHFHPVVLIAYYFLKIKIKTINIGIGFPNFTIIFLKTYIFMNYCCYMLIFFLLEEKGKIHVLKLRWWCWCACLLMFYLCLNLNRCGSILWSTHIKRGMISTLIAF